MLLSYFLLGIGLVAAQFTPDWKSLDARPVPKWFDEAKVGIFIHWGVFSVPSWGTTGGAAGEWYWWNLDGAKDPAYNAFHDRVYGPDFKYADFATRFTAELWDPSQWADLFQKSGAKYVVLTSKHHEGWTNWPSKYSWNWNSGDLGPHRDLVGDLSKTVRGAGLRFGLYHSLFEWFNPLYLQDKANNFSTSVYVDTVLQPELAEIVNNYQPDVIWSDGDWEANDDYWKSKQFLAWLYNNATNKDTVCVNDRWGAGDGLTHGGYYSGGDRFNPGKLLTHKWENAFTLDTTTWGYKRNSVLANYLSITDVLNQLISTVACGGNVLINIGPTHDGTIAEVMQERLLQLGAWLQVNGEAIYGSVPWKYQNESNVGVWYTQSPSSGAVYALTTVWPNSTKLHLALPQASGATVVKLLGYPAVLPSSAGASGGIDIQVPTLSINTLPSPYAWAFKITGLS